MKKLTKKAAEMTTKELAAYIELCEPYVKGTDTMLCPVTDFPFGTSSTKSKVEQIEDVAKYDTVKEVDVVANFGHIRAGKYAEVTADIKACVDAAHKYGRELTGFDAHGATPEIIKVMQEEVGDKCKVKGSGCIRTREHFLQLIDMGIDRMGVGYRSVPVVLDLDK
mgnify:CR=1 FL=1